MDAESKKQRDPRNAIMIEVIVADNYGSENNGDEYHQNRHGQVWVKIDAAEWSKAEPGATYVGTITYQSLYQLPPYLQH